MKSRKTSVYFMAAMLVMSLSALASSRTGIASSAPNPGVVPSPAPDTGPEPLNLLRCEFQRPGVKGEEGIECHAQVTGLIGRDYGKSFIVNLRVECDDELIYDSLARGTAAGTGQFATGVVAATSNTSIAHKPVIVVDGNFVNAQAFEDRDARLYLGHGDEDLDRDDAIYGTCDHEGFALQTEAVK